jgi:hypothetical protein
MHPIITPPYKQTNHLKLSQAKWNYTLPLSQDQAQWNQLTKKWLALTPTQRKPWYEAGFSVESALPSSPALPTQEQINRIFGPHQTDQERRHGVLLGAKRTIWLRTCYAPELEDAYQDMFDGVEEWVVDPEDIFDDEALYAFGDKWDRLLQRIPGLCDTDRDEERLVYEDERPEPDDPQLPLYEAALREIVLVYLLDRQALMEKLVTVIWLDCHGECVWWYRIKVDNLQTLTGWLADTAGLGGMLELAEADDDGERMFEKGRLIDWLDF